MEDAPSPIQPSRFKLASITGWGPVSAIVVTLIAYFGSQIIGGVVVAIYPLSQGWTSAQINTWLEQSVYAQFFLILAVEAITLIIVWQFLKHRKVKAGKIGLKRPRPIDIAYALSGFGVYILIYIVMLQVVSKVSPNLDFNQKQELGFSTSVTGLALVLTFISLVILPPVVEEIVVRGFLYTGLRNKLSIITATLITSVLFASAHLQAGSGKPLLWVAAVDTFTLSLVLIYLRQKTKSLSASIMLHMIKNGIAFVSLFIIHVPR